MLNPGRFDGFDFFQNARAENAPGRVPSLADPLMYQGDELPKSTMSVRKGCAELFSIGINTVCFFCELVSRPSVCEAKNFQLALQRRPQHVICQQLGWAA